MASPVPAMMMMAAPLRSTQPRCALAGDRDLAHDEADHAEDAADGGGDRGGQGEPADVPEPAHRGGPTAVHSTGSADERAVSQE